MTAHERIIEGYYRNVSMGKMLLEQVPEKYRAEVEARFKEQ